jgi:hypothetical protein
MTSSLKDKPDGGAPRQGSNMTISHAATSIVAADPIEVFCARCEARAHLVAAGDFELHEAVDGLQEAVERTGLVTSLGQDAVQAMMAVAFETTIQAAHKSDAPASPANEPYRRVSEHGVASAAELQRTYERALATQFRHRLPASTVEALNFVIRQKDPSRLRQFIAARTPSERGLIKAHFS